MTMKNILPIFFLLFTISETAFAQRITVKKTKGHNALIESSVPLEEGQVYELQSASVSEAVNYKTIGLKSRQNSWMIGGNFVTIRGEDYQKNAGALHTRYGWNFTQLEFGLAAEMSSLDVGAGATTDFLLGGYFDYNLVSNRDPKSFIYGPFVLASFGSIQSPSSRGGGSTSIVDMNLGGFATWFVAGASAALRLEGYYDYQQINSTVKQIAATGFGTRGFIVFYF
ncbi:MAG: hypothetical protein H7061_09900 [Bdellovibrionaceae bacterium]|nr:hypothetical protein [Bdellovibrio sp.]